VTAVQSCGVASEIVSNVREPEGQIDDADFNGGNAVIRSSPGEKAPGFLISSFFPRPYPVSRYHRRGPIEHKNGPNERCAFTPIAI